MRQPETAREWLDYYEKLRARADDNYQQTGEQRYYNAEFKYSQICDAFRARIAQQAEREVDIKGRMRNFEYVTGQLISKTYTRDEVVEMLRKAVWW